jgi:hypothetical protein
MLLYLRCLPEMGLHNSRILGWGTEAPANRISRDVTKPQGVKPLKHYNSNQISKVSNGTWPKFEIREGQATCFFPNQFLTFSVGLQPQSWLSSCWITQTLHWSRAKGWLNSKKSLFTKQSSPKLMGTFSEVDRVKQTLISVNVTVSYVEPLKLL